MCLLLSTLLRSLRFNDPVIEHQGVQAVAEVGTAGAGDFVVIKHASLFTSTLLSKVLAVRCCLLTFSYQCPNRCPIWRHRP